ncbi:MAG: M14 family metallopeptidase, partial [Longimicrobiales bacterium]
MQKRTWFSTLAACSLAVSMTLTAPAPAAAQEKLQQSPGGYHGELDFPISWKRYYNYEEWTGILHDLQDQYDHLSSIRSIGKSRMGRDQYLLTITAESTGSADSKPAMWVDGAIHGNEVNGIMCSLYTAWYLLTRYDYDPFVHDLVNSTTFYILPGLNVDANDSFVRFPNTPNNPRETYRPEDNDGDGLYDEDRTEDVDGDGELSYMYVEDPDGPLKLTTDGRAFVEVADDAERVTRFRRIGPEGYDNDGDGRINEDDLGGPDPNRNFPYGWNLEAGNPYPLSEPETRNVWEFQRTHPNIFASFHFHNTGRLIMFQAPPPVQGQSAGPGAAGPYGTGRGQRMTVEEQRELLRQTNKYAQLFDRQVAPEYQHDMDVQTEIVTMGARILKNYDPVIGGLSGQAHAAAYYMLGAYAYLIELWGSPAFAADENDDGRVSQEEILKWIDTELM